MSQGRSRAYLGIGLALVALAAGPAAAATRGSTLNVRATVVDGCSVSRQGGDVQVDLACGGTKATRNVVQPSSALSAATPAGAAAPVGVTTDQAGGINYLTVIY